MFQHSAFQGSTLSPPSPSETAFPMSPGRSEPLQPPHLITVSSLPVNRAPIGQRPSRDLDRAPVLRPAFDSGLRAVSLRESKENHPAGSLVACSGSSHLQPGEMKGQDRCQLLPGPRGVPYLPWAVAQLTLAFLLPELCWPFGFGSHGSRLCSRVRWGGRASRGEGPWAGTAELQISSLMANRLGPGRARAQI